MSFKGLGIALLIIFIKDGFLSEYEYGLLEIFWLNFDLKIFNKIDLLIEVPFFKNWFILG